MPNWCDTEYRFYGKTGDIKAFHSKLTKWTSKDYCENCYGNSWLGNILIGAGFDMELNEDGRIPYWEHIGCRGLITGLSDISILENDTAEFTAVTESAWCATPVLWVAVIQKFSWDITFDFLEVEPGMGIYCRYFGDGRMESEPEYYADAWAEENPPEGKLKELLETFAGGVCITESELKDTLADILEADRDTEIEKLISEAVSLCRDTNYGRDRSLSFNEFQVLDKREMMEIG